MKTRRIVISTVLLVGGLLSIVQVMPKNPLLIGERLFPYGGWIGQLALGIFADPIFLMTGKLHLPIPAVILAGPLYRFEGLFMPILFISTLLLSGPAWCSQLCYFGAFDAWSARGKLERKRFPYHKQMRYSILFLE